MPPSAPAFEIKHVTATEINPDPGYYKFLVTVKMKTEMVNEVNPHALHKDEVTAAALIVLGLSDKNVFAKVDQLKERVRGPQPQFFKIDGKDKRLPVWEFALKKTPANERAWKDAMVWHDSIPINGKNLEIICHPVSQKFDIYVKKDTFGLTNIKKSGKWPPIVAYQKRFPGGPHRVFHFMDPFHPKAGGYLVADAWHTMNFSALIDYVDESKYMHAMKVFSDYPFLPASAQEKIAITFKHDKKMKVFWTPDADPLENTCVIKVGSMDST